MTYAKCEKERRSRGNECRIDRRETNFPSQWFTTCASGLVTTIQKKKKRIIIISVDYGVCDNVPLLTRPIENHS